MQILKKPFNCLKLSVNLHSSPSNNCSSGLRSTVRINQPLENLARAPGDVAQLKKRLPSRHKEPWVPSLEPHETGCGSADL